MTRLLCLNTDPGTIPAGGCVRLSEVNAAASSKAEVQYTAIKPEGGTNFYFINGPIPTLTGKTFFVDDPGRITRALVDAGASFGDTVGPASGSWTMDADGTGFEVIGDLGADGLTPVLRQESVAGGGHIMHYQIEDCDADNYYVTPTEWTGGCGNPPGQDAYTGLWTVVKLSCTAPWTVADIDAGTVYGVATYTYPFGGDPCTPYWKEISSCGPSECG